MIAFTLAVALVGADTPAPSCAPLASVIATPCDTASVTADAEAFLAGKPSALGKMLQQLDAEGRLSEVLSHAQLARNYWRQGKPTPRAAGH